MKTADIRARFLEFFRDRGHTVVPSAPLVPGNDPTLLFTNSGMVQFKNVFLGSEKPGYVRAVRRAALPARRRQAQRPGLGRLHGPPPHLLRDARQLVVRRLLQARGHRLGLGAADRGLRPAAPRSSAVTVYETDDEAYAIWKDEIGVPAERIIRIGDNKGAPYASATISGRWPTPARAARAARSSTTTAPHIPGGPPGSPDEDGDRFIEIWNLVFMQFDRQPDGTLAPLPAPCVDTGMGLERLAAILQGVHSNYEIDLFQHLISKAAELTGTKDLGNKSLRVIADHIRACAFLIVDGVLPSNEGRGYVLRRIIRRALRHGWMLGTQGEFFWKMVAPLVAEMGEPYPELAKAQSAVEKALKQEEQRFGETLEQGMKLFEDVVAGGDGRIVAGEDAFRLYDTYGFPLDLTADIARERGMDVDMDGFERAMQAQRERARAASRFESKGQLPAELVSTLKPTQFLGYEALEAGDAKVVAMVRDGVALDTLEDGEDAVVLLDRTPFYAESGGQVGDTGELAGARGRFVVEDTQKMAGTFHGHVGRWSGDQPLTVGQVLDARVDADRRQAVVLNHSATHLLHAALRKVLGEHVTQKGSLVAPERLRFDFSHDQSVTAEQLRRIEAMVNAQIRRNDAADIRHMGYQEAIDFGAMALFGEKYGDQVRVLRMGEFSTELCGGTHVSRTGDIGLFKIVSESGVAAGIRRIEALTGAGAESFVIDEELQLRELAGQLGASVGDAGEKLRQLLERSRRLERELEAVKARAASAASADLASSAKEIKGVRLVAARLPGMDGKALRESMDHLKQKLGDCVVLLASAHAGKATLVGGVHGAALEKVKAGVMIAHVAGQIGGKGGGRPDMAQGGGEDSPALDAALEALPQWLEAQLG